MSKFTSFDIEEIKKCIRVACNCAIEKARNSPYTYGFSDSEADLYRIHNNNTQEAERLIDLMETLSIKENL